MEATPVARVGGREVEDDEIRNLGRSIMAACNDPQFHQCFGRFQFRLRGLAGRVVASSVEVTLNSSFGWEYTTIIRL